LNIKQDRFLVKEGSYVIDLDSVEFITFTQNENNTNQYLLKFHIGTKEARVMADSISDAISILEKWSELRANIGTTYTENDIKRWRN
tara:strand:- start:3997 stop:4257 length:261 start_codon:yes stop_codon:yes gene_type:complete